MSELITIIGIVVYVLGVVVVGSLGLKFELESHSPDLFETAYIALTWPVMLLTMALVMVSE
jgi:hypothetical protein